MPLPLILAFDTSGPWCCVAVLQGDRLLALRHDAMEKGQAEHLMPLIEVTLAEAGATVADLSAIGVGVGPGNFTGIRISVSAARGLALALGIPAVGVSMLEALAHEGQHPLLASLDARRDHVYLQRFGDGIARGPARVPLEDAHDWAVPDLSVVGPNAEQVAAMTHAHHSHAAYPVAEVIARIAASHWQSPDLPRPAPLYLRSADAAPSRDDGPEILPR